MASVVEICNRALSQIGSRPINTLEESSIEARVCKLHYLPCLHEVLSAVDWSFARRVHRLARFADATVPGWKYVHKIPTDSLVIRSLVPEHTIENRNGALFSNHCVNLRDPHFAYEVMSIWYDDGITAPKDTSVIVSNIEDAYAFYTAEVTDPNTFPPLFVRGLMHLLAATIASQIMGVELGDRKTITNMNYYNSVLSQAMVNSANERSRVAPDSDIILARL